MRKTALLFVFLLASVVTLIAASQRAHAARTVSLEPPGRDQQAHIDGDAAILPNGRRVTPAGRVLRTESYAWGLALSPDGRRAALVHEKSLELVDLVEPFGVRRIPPYGSGDHPELGSGGYMGVAFSRDGSHLFYGSADEGAILELDIASARVTRRLPLNDAAYHDSFAGDFTLSVDGRRLLAVDQFNYRVADIDLASGRVTRSIRVGRNPFAIAAAPDGRTAWVSNVGMFEYPLVPGVTKETRTSKGLPFPVYGVPSRDAREGVTTQDGRRVPGLGDANAPEAMSVFAVRLDEGRVSARVKTGYLVGAERDDLTTVGGSSPAAVVAGRRFVYVSNATNDTISVIDGASGKIVREIALNVPGLEGLRGVLPFGEALSPDERRLYVACAGLNAVAVIDTERRSVEGYIPAGWFASEVALTADGHTLVVASAKGLGSGPNGGAGFVDPARGAHPGDIMQGTLQLVPVPDRARLDAYTRQVIDNTYVTHPTAPLPPLLRDHPIRHVVFIVKENRTFDQVFGSHRGVRGDASLAELAAAAPNHQALADRFALSDNFYCDSDQSNTGHRWVVGVYPNEWVEVNARSHIEARPFSTAPGRRNVAGSSATVLPEDYNEAGALWEQLARHHVSFFNLGFGTEMPESLEERMFKDTGIRMTVSFPLPKPLFDRTSRRYPTFNMRIPDQYRADVFEQELRERWQNGREPFPQLLTMVLPNDHLTDPKPEYGYPQKASYMADNDYALGRVIQTLSRSRWWPETLVIVVEDDPQGGRDHVDAHRSILMLIGPHVRRGYVSPTLASFGSVMRLIFTVLGMPSLNQFDATASLPLDMFGASLDLEPYTPLLPDRALFDPATAPKPSDPGFDWHALTESPVMDDPDDMRRGYRSPATADERNHRRSGDQERRR
jgi:DNA-binding beta-propeller fold protein YncE